MKSATEVAAITATLHGWAAFHTEWKVHFHSHALQTPAGVILIDPTRPGPEALKQLAALGEPAAIVLTNAHHDRDAQWFRREFGLQIHAHENAQHDCDTRIDVPVMDGESILGELTAHFLPGVSDSELALFSPQDGGIVLLGDAILHGEGKELELLPEVYIEDKKQARQSLRKLLELDFQTLTFGHGAALKTEGRKQLAKFLKTK